MANDLNQCSFIGRIGGDPEMRYTTGGDAVASFSIAVGSSWKDKAGEKQERTEWVNITAWGKLGEICGEYLNKGQQVFIQGKIKTDKYEKDGVTRYSTKIVAETMQMLGGKSQGDGEQSEPARSAPAAKPATPAAKGNFEDFANDDLDVPF